MRMGTTDTREIFAADRAATNKSEHMNLPLLQAREKAAGDGVEFWIQKTLRLKFVFGGILLHSVKFSGIVVDRPFHELTADPVPPRPPLEALDQGMRAVRIPSHP